MPRYPNWHEGAASNTVQCGFESHSGHLSPQVNAIIRKCQWYTRLWFHVWSEVRLQASALIDSGHSLRSISMSMGINRSTLREWRDYPEKERQSRGHGARAALANRLCRNLALTTR